MNDKHNKTNAMRQLDSMGISYKVLYYDCDTFTDGVSVANLLHLDPEQCFKTLVAVAKSGKHYVFVIPVAEEIDLKIAAKSVNEKNVELIHVKDLKNTTGYIRGGCSPIGMKKLFVTVVDETCVLYDEIYVSGGDLGVQLCLSPSDLLRVTKASACSITKT